MITHTQNQIQWKKKTSCNSGLQNKNQLINLYIRIQSERIEFPSHFGWRASKLISTRAKLTTKKETLFLPICCSSSPSPLHAIDCTNCVLCNFYRMDNKNKIFLINNIIHKNEKNPHLFNCKSNKIATRSTLQKFVSQPK